MSSDIPNHLLLTNIMTSSSTSPPLSPRQSDVSFSSTHAPSTGVRPSSSPPLTNTNTSADTSTNRNTTASTSPNPLPPYVSTSTISMPRSSHASTETETRSASPRGLSLDDEDVIPLSPKSSSPLNTLINSSSHKKMKQKPVSHNGIPNSNTHSKRTTPNNQHHNNNKPLRHRHPHHQSAPIPTSNSNTTISNDTSSSRNANAKSTNKHNGKPGSSNNNNGNSKTRPHSQPPYLHNPLLLEPLSTGRLPKARVFVHRAVTPPSPPPSLPSIFLSSASQQQQKKQQKQQPNSARLPSTSSPSSSCSSSTHHHHNNHMVNTTARCLSDMRAHQNSNPHHQHQQQQTTRLHTDLAEAAAYLCADTDLVPSWVPPRDELQDWNSDSFTSSASSSFDHQQEQQHQQQQQQNQRRPAITYSNNRRSDSRAQSNCRSHSNSHAHDDVTGTEAKWATSLRNLAGMARGRDRSPPCIRGSILEVEPPTLYERFGLAALHKKTRIVSGSQHGSGGRRPRAKTDLRPVAQPFQQQRQHQQVFRRNARGNGHYDKGDVHRRHNQQQEQQEQEQHLVLSNNAITTSRAQYNNNWNNVVMVKTKTGNTSMANRSKSYRSNNRTSTEMRPDEYVGFLLDNSPSAPSRNKPRRWLRFFRRRQSNNMV